MTVSPARPSPSLARRIFLACFGVLVALFVRVLGATWRYRILGADPYHAAHGKKVFLGAGWHRNILIAAHYFRDRGYLTMVSQSRDGDLVSAVVPHLGYLRPVRGSSSRGGANALRAQIELTRNGVSSGLFCDGPRGPARVVKSGIMHLAAATQTELTPVAFSATPCIRFKSWDRTILPKPFAEVVVAFGDPITIPENLSKAELEAKRIEMEKTLNELTDRVDAECGMSPL